MGIAYNPKVITDGLVLALDAGNTKSYPGIGTAWTDLSGNGNNGTLENDVGYDSGNGGALSFDGSNEHVTLVSNSNFSFGTGDFTIECWVWRNGSQSETAGIIITYPNAFVSAPVTTWQLSMGRAAGGNNVNKLVFYIGNDLNFRLDDPDVFPNQTWTYVAVTRSGSTINLYKNLTLVDSGTSSQNLSDDDLAIGINRGGDSFWKGYISNTRVYKGKALTTAELSQNFNALRGRYGI